MRILVGDIGGTHTRLAVWQDGSLQDERVVPSRDHAGLDGPLAAWMRDLRAPPDRACLAVAGPVRDGRCTATNLPWVVDAHALRTRLAMPVEVVNDFEAAARGIALLTPGDWVELVPGEPVAGCPQAVLGAGTGLGEALVLGDVVIPGEGGHAEFGPGDARDLALAAWLIARHGRASWEDVLSGPGLVNLARFRAEQAGTPTAWLDDDDAAAEVATRDPAALAWFCALYGAEAGNLALRSLARGGVWLCGGIAPRVLDALRAGGFAARFRAKGRVSPALDGIPVRVVVHPALGLLGAAATALRHVRERTLADTAPCV
ncbi:MAG: hypothetical protein RLZZ299_523 [Pseudomonadota bacterium]